jgi:hypothetical protein
MRLFTIAALATASLAATSFRAEACNPLVGHNFGKHVAPTTLPAAMLAKNHPATPGPHTIVGLWHMVRTASDGSLFTEGFDMWNLGGTELELTNHPPAVGNVCIGVYTVHGRDYDLTTHVAWLYDLNNNFDGTLNIAQTNKLARDGNSYDGQFDAKFYDPNGVLFMEVTGTAHADRLVQ